MSILGSFVLHTVVVLLGASGSPGEPVAMEPASATPVATAVSIAEPSVEATLQDEGGVRFENVSRDIQYVLATYNGEKCGEMSDRAQLELAPGEEGTVDSGDSRVCYCASSLGKVGNCDVWSKAKPGKKVTLR